MKDKDFVEIDFVGKLAATGEIFDLTSEERAKKAGIHSSSQKYGPALVIIGAGMVIPGVEENLREMKPGEKRKFNVTPDKGFGSRNPALVKIISRAKFVKENINPLPGMFVNIDGKNCRIQSVSGGRVRVDFNHPLAGRELDYEVSVVRQIKTPLDKVRALVNHYRINAEVKETGKDITLTPEKPLNPLQKQLLTREVGKWVPGTRINFAEPKQKPKENFKSLNDIDNSTKNQPKQAFKKGLTQNQQVSKRKDVSHAKHT